MILRLLAPATDHPGPGTAFAWTLASGAGAVLREGRSPLADAPRADRVELVLPASRVLFARLALPKVSAGTLRELLPFAVEDRLLGDPSQVHAVTGATNAKGETLVAVVDRRWFGALLELVRGAGLAPARVFAESAYLGTATAPWTAVLSEGPGVLVEADGHGSAFDPPTGTAPPLALRIALDEASARDARPASLDVAVETGVSAPDAAAWSEALGLPVKVRTLEGRFARAAAPGAIDLLAGDFSASASPLGGFRVPRLAIGLAAALALAQFGFTAADAWRLDAERRRLEAEREAIFREAFPEAKTVVDPALQMRRNLDALARGRGEAGASDFLAQVAAASAQSPAPARRLAYDKGKLEVTRGETPISAKAAAPVASSAQASPKPAEKGPAK
jgi:general secretion pathway protein L